MYKYDLSDQTLVVSLSCISIVMPTDLVNRQISAVKVLCQGFLTLYWHWGPVLVSQKRCSITVNEKGGAEGLHSLAMNPASIQHGCSAGGVKSGIISGTSLILGEALGHFQDGPLLRVSSSTLAQAEPSIASFEFDQTILLGKWFQNVSHRNVRSVPLTTSYCIASPAACMFIQQVLKVRLECHLLVCQAKRLCLCHNLPRVKFCLYSDVWAKRPFPMALRPRSSVRWYPLWEWEPMETATWTLMIHPEIVGQKQHSFCPVVCKGFLKRLNPVSSCDPDAGKTELWHRVSHFCQHVCWQKMCGELCTLEPWTETCSWYPVRLASLHLLKWPAREWRRGNLLSRAWLVAWLKSSRTWSSGPGFASETSTRNWLDRGSSSLVACQSFGLQSRADSSGFKMIDAWWCKIDCWWFKNIPDIAFRRIWCWGKAWRSGLRLHQNANRKSFASGCGGDVVQCDCSERRGPSNHPSGNATQDLRIFVWNFVVLSNQFLWRADSAGPPQSME